MDPRIGAAFLKAGIGYGGSCFPKDTRALQHIADTNGYDFKLLSAVIEVNNAQKFKVIEKLEHELIQLQGAKVAVLGLTFKPNTDDLREAPSLPIIEALLQRGAEVYVHDPVAIEKARLLLPSAVHFTHELTDAIRDAEAAILITEWPEYIRLDAGLANKLMRRPLFVDGRNALGEDARSQLEYRGIGLAGKAKLSNEVQVNV
jgi:UDPglucose 6-dehydrogenase